MNLYDLKENYKNLEAVLETAEDENLKEMLIAALNEVEDSISAKAENVVYYIKNLESDVAAIKEEEKRLSEKRKSVEKKVNNLKEYLFNFTKGADGGKIKGNIFTVSIKKNPASVVVDDLTAIPAELIRIKTIAEADKTEIKKILKNGEEVPGARLEQKESLNIK